MAVASRACAVLLAHRLLLTSHGRVAPTVRSTVAPIALMGVHNFGSHKDGKKKKRDSSSSSSSSSSSDSDRDTRKSKHPKGKRGQSEFWLRKMRTHHVAMDVNKDGVVSWDDFEQMIQRFGTIGLLKPEEKQSFEDALRHVWEEEWGASGDPYAFINQEQFITNMEHVVNSDELRKKVAKPLPFFFQAVDHDSSGEITIDEYKMYFKCLGLSDEAAVASFSAIDINNDGKLSKKEFLKLGREFFLSEDEMRPSKLFWGPLV